ncbi:MAG: universal stress protein [Bacteroidota bacterium]|nr:universal stress protein [Bacteroidota bacterium]MDP4215583.1 universal stress protein [Bacteroidota bacterium]MDP4246205.1 universal stress protein [Bacteroidota bacterium]MDP4255513.1 universal stress protein [Bacteroidota bacterium]MDP4257774.1 universal stress protein [Bacteroidota bacterium]
MKKVIAAFDGLRFSESTLQQAVSLALQHNAHLVGVFLYEYTRRSFVIYESIVAQTRTGRDFIDELEKQDRTTYEASAARFEEACNKAGIDCTVHRDKANALKALLHESIFADLLLIDRSETFTYLDEDMPGWFVRNLLHDVHCPVWLVSPVINPVSRLIFFYDGTPSSVQAIKAFTYIFPEMGVKDAEVITLASATHGLNVPDSSLMTEWMRRHYPSATFKVLKNDRSDLADLVKEYGSGSLLICGAYERDRLSTWLFHSFADQLMKKTDSPLFIAH